MDSRPCSAIRELLPRYAADQLTTGEQIAVERHIASCVDCRAELGEWLTLGEWVAQAEAAIPHDANSERSLAAIHAQLRHSSADDLDGFDRSALSTMPAQDSPRDTTGQRTATPSPTVLEWRQTTASPEDTSSKLCHPQLLRRHTAPAMAWVSVAVFIALVASLFYLLAPQVRLRQSAVTPTATATTLPIATPMPTSGSWHTAAALPAQVSAMTFSKSDPQTGYFCKDLGVGVGPTQASSSQWLYKSDDGGMTWRPVGGITPPTLAQMSCDIFIDSNDASDVFVQLVCSCGAGVARAPGQTLWRSRDGGATWRQLAMPPLYRGWANLVVVGSRIVGLGTDDSAERTPYPPTCSTDPNTTALHQVNDLFASDDGGMTWKPIGQPLISQGLSIIPGDSVGVGLWSPSILSIGTALFVRTYCLTEQGNAREQQTYWRSSDGGKTWTKLPTPDSEVYFTPSAAGGAYGVSVNPGLDAERSTPPVILYSHDSGASWTTLPSVGDIPLPPHFTKSAAGCVDTCYTHYSAPMVMALPDGSVLAVIRVGDSANTPTIYSSHVYVIDPQSPHPVWRQFAPTSVGAAPQGAQETQWLAGWPLAATRHGLVLWARTLSGRWVYLSPLP